ncbi:hypothetical protein GNI_170790 [Gregarina niphandrodes]|uniref:Uncharacterized protein n=1 Tax=Gregarina niphandrodes TaxID=110365 RepID=A0A023AYW7_GRENI|nr:hypothetical protein GNI_170790 [Gregarina niphandrodes]EZG43470.1 hypothetical protein GNI_170790 [Gregarina niphandrodes]|eukprot:XP_011133297.1 hypothetical protein GNI_170790 [Gregarina niphandrodes]
MTRGVRSEQESVQVVSAVALAVFSIEAPHTHMRMQLFTNSELETLILAGRSSRFTSVTPEMMCSEERDDVPWVHDILRTTNVIELASKTGNKEGVRRECAGIDGFCQIHPGDIRNSEGIALSSMTIKRGEFNEFLVDLHFQGSGGFVAPKTRPSPAHKSAEFFSDVSDDFSRSASQAAAGISRVSNHVKKYFSWGKQRK